jgi:serine/threonine-protein kinase RIM15
MAEPLPPRRQPPSPLVFSPEYSLPLAVAPSVSSGSAHGSGANTVSMPFVRRHVTRRLKAAKQECDKELQRVTNSITSFFEEKLHEGELEREQRDRERERDQQSPDPEFLREAFVLQQAEPKSASAFLSDDASSDGGYEAELEGNHSRQRASLDATPRSPPTLTHSSSSPGLHVASLTASSPSVIRRQATISWDKAPAPPSTAPNSAAGSSQAEEGTSPRKQSTTANTSRSSGGIASRRLSLPLAIAPEQPF